MQTETVGLPTLLFTNSIGEISLAITNHVQLDMRHFQNIPSKESGKHVMHLENISI